MKRNYDHTYMYVCILLLNKQIFQFTRDKLLSSFTNIRVPIH